MRGLKAGTTTTADGRLTRCEVKARLDEKSESPEKEATSKFLREEMSKIIPEVEFTSETSRDFKEDWGLPT